MAAPSSGLQQRKRGLDEVLRLGSVSPGLHAGRNDPSGVSRCVGHLAGHRGYGLGRAECEEYCVQNRWVRVRNSVQEH